MRTVVSALSVEQPAAGAMNGATSSKSSAGAGIQINCRGRLGPRVGRSGAEIASRFHRRGWRCPDFDEPNRGRPARDGAPGTSGVRIALLGPRPLDIGGLPYRVLNTILGLAEAGHEVEVFAEGHDLVPDSIDDAASVRIHSFGRAWEYDQWYSRNDTTKLLTGTAARVLAQRDLVKGLLQRHRDRPFDVVYRLSLIELFSLGPALKALPPLVLHPGTHAAGELRWHWRERRLALGAENPVRFASAHAYLAARALIQRHDLPRARAVVALSDHFAAELRRDYRISADRLHVVPNPINLDRFRPGPPDAVDPGQTIRALFVAAMAVRKGVEQIVALSHRLGDLAGQLTIECVGGARLFSDYRHLLRDLNPAVAFYRGYLSPVETAEAYRKAHFALQPSRYEPFGNSVGEALSSGLPVVASREVGASERLDPRVARLHDGGDLGGLERRVRALLTDLRSGQGAELSALARVEAERRFSIDAVTAAIVQVLELAARR